MAVYWRKMKLALTRAEIEELTERRRPAAQARVLRALGIDFRVRPDGSLLVLRENLLHSGLVRANLCSERFQIRYQEEGKR